MRVRIVIVSALLTLAVAACASTGGGAASTATEPPGPHLTVIASGIAYDTKELKFTADQPTAIYFMNHDSGVPHDIAISATQGGPTTFAGEIISQGAIVYQVPAYGAGTYFFFCTVHPNMNGTVTVSP